MEPDTINLIFVSVFGATLLLGMLLVFYLFRIGYKCVPSTSKTHEDVELKQIRREFTALGILIDPKQVIIFTELLGFGQFGAVYSSILRISQQNGMEIYVPVAVKTLLLRDSQNRAELIGFLKEAKRQHVMKHPNIIQLKGICMETASSPLVIMEKVDGKSLYKYLQLIREGKQEPLTLQHICLILLQIASAGVCLHEHNHIHRDIAARNVMLTKNFVAKLGDFGLCRNLYGENYYIPQSNVCLPTAWVPPEVFKEDGKFTLKSDVWMYGVLLWEILTTGSIPHENESPVLIIQKITSPNSDDRYLPDPPHASTPSFLIELMHNCWALAPSERPAFTEIVDLLTKSVHLDSAYDSLLESCYYQPLTLPTPIASPGTALVHSVRPDLLPAVPSVGVSSGQCNPCFEAEEVDDEDKSACRRLQTPMVMAAAWRIYLDPGESISSLIAASVIGERPGTSGEHSVTTVDAPSFRAPWVFDFHRKEKRPMYENVGVSSSQVNGL